MNENSQPSKYLIHFWFEHGGICLWARNDRAREKFKDFAIPNKILPVSEELIRELNLLETEYHGYLNWDYPPDPSPWTTEHKCDFIRRATLIYERLVVELGGDYEVINRVEDCVG